jgi:hypothetical protein
MTEMENKLGTISQSLQKEPINKNQQTVMLYYFNYLEDAKLPIEQQINTSSIRPVRRTVSSENIIETTIKLLLE